MKNTSETIVFFGSGPVAAESLRRLHKNFAIEAVVTKPRPDHHRGSVPVLELAEELALPVVSAPDRQTLSAVMAQQHFSSRLAVLIDFGIIVGQDVIDCFELGIVNSHFSILPEWRGADPISFAILSGQPQTGVSLMMLVEKMDEGPLVSYGEYDLFSDITTPQLTDELVALSDALLVHDLPGVLAGTTTLVPQSVTKRNVSYSRKLTKEDGQLDFAKPAVQLEREIRAFIEWPKSRTSLAGKDVIATKAHVIEADGPEGALYQENGLLGVYCGQGALIIDELKPAGKTVMSGSAFLHGYMQ